MRKPLAWLAAGAVAMVVAGFTVGAVFADDGAASGTDLMDTFLERLAGKLGVDEGRLRDAVKETELELVDEAVSEGRISEERAERIRERIEGGQFGFFGGPRGHHFGHPGVLALHPFDAAAEALGISREALLDELRDGKTLAQVAEEHGVSRDDLRTALIDAAKEALDGAVQEGKVTQERADEILTRFTEHVDEILDHSFPHGPFGRFES